MNEPRQSKCKHDYDGGDFMSTQQGEKKKCTKCGRWISIKKIESARRAAQKRKFTTRRSPEDRIKAELEFRKWMEE
jgi:hypothetical protein